MYRNVSGGVDPSGTSDGSGDEGPGRVPTMKNLAMEDPIQAHGDDVGVDRDLPGAERHGNVVSSAVQRAMDAWSAGGDEDAGDDDERDDSDDERPGLKVTETVLHDRDDDEEDEAEFSSHLVGMQDRQTAKSGKKKVPATLQQSVRKDTLEGIVQQLPDATEVVVPVMAEVHRRCTGHKEHLAESALALCALAPNKAVVVSLWQFYLDTLLENAGGVLGSKNAAEFTFTRLKAHGSRLRLFLNDDSNREVALDIAGELRFERDLSGVYNLIQQVTLAYLTEALGDVSRARVVYPTQVVDLDKDRRQFLFYIAGWMLSSALTRVSRDGRLRSSFMPFVNTHKYDTGSAFLSAHPSLEGVEFEVADRNVSWHGKGLFFASASFFEFVYTLERGYRHALKNPLLLATYLGDIPSEIFHVVSKAPAVKEAWSACVAIVRGGGVVDGDTAGKFDQLFNFLLLKWHRCRISEYTKRLSKVSKSQKEAKATGAARRDELKIVSSKRGSKISVTHVGSKELTEEEKTLALSISKIGARCFNFFNGRTLRAYIQKCGGAQMNTKKKSIEELREMLRTLCPGAGGDEPEESVAPAV